MLTRDSILTIAALVAVAGASLAAVPVVHAQTTTPAHVAAAVAKVNAAQLAFVTKLAHDSGFARRFTAAAARGDYGAATDLLATATGMPVSSVRVSPKWTPLPGLTRGELLADIGASGRTTDRPPVAHLASLEQPSRVRDQQAPSGKVCFDVASVEGCIAF